MPLFRGTFFKKNAELWVSVFALCAELWVPFEEICRVMMCKHQRAESANNYFNGTFREIVEPNTNFDGTRRSQKTRITINHLH